MSRVHHRKSWCGRGQATCCLGYACVTRMERAVCEGIRVTSPSIFLPPPPTPIEAEFILTNRKLGDLFRDTVLCECHCFPRLSRGRLNARLLGYLLPSYDIDEIMELHVHRADDEVRTRLACTEVARMAKMPSYTGHRG